MSFKSLHILSLFTFLWVSAFSFAQTNEERKKSADKNFENENYVEATTDYLHLLSLDPMSHELNFKYGACLLYNSKNKGKAIRYLNYAVQDENGDPRAHYFRGKALHLNFQFEEAKQNYKNYKNRAGGKTDDRYKVDRAIEMCENGKRLLTTFTDIIVAEKKEIDQSKFFRIYSDSKTIGGEILVTENFQSKLDKKMGHIPIVHFPPQAKAIYYSSYGEDLATGLDIYIRRRLPVGGWGEPQLLPGAVNTAEDEDFPYMHPSGQFLYFSSTGHNSMGGYDIFMSRFDPELNSFKTPENVDFAISSPDDDLFYVVDSLFQNAYFASARQSEDGNLHVYRVKVARVPIQEIIVMGDFLSEINPDNKSMNIAFASHSNGEEVGKVSSNAKGKYSFVFPQGGKYDYLVEVEGSDTQYKFTVELPFLSEFRPLKQKIIHTNEGGEEIVKVINLFDEDVEGAEALIAGIIRKKSELDINIDKYDLDAIETEAKKKTILAALGFDNMTLNEVKDQLAELKETNEDNQADAERIEANLNSEILAKSERIKTLDALENELAEKANATNDPLTKHKLLNEAYQKEIEKEKLINSVEALIAIKEDTKGKIGLPDQQVDELGKVVEDFVDAIEGGDDVAAIKLLDENDDLIQAAKNGSPNQLVNNIVDEKQELEAQTDKYQDQNDEYAKSVEQLNRDINALESKLLDSKKKEAEKIKTEIDAKKEELSIIKKEIDRNDTAIVASNKKISGLNDQIDGLQNAFDTETVADVDVQEVTSSVKEVNEIASNIGVDYPAEIAKVEAENPQVFGVASIDRVSDIKNDKSIKEQSVTSDPTLSELEKAYELKGINENAIVESSNEIEALEKLILANPNDDEVKAEKIALEEFIASLEEENKELDNQVAELKTETPDAALSKEDVVAEIDPGYKEDIAELEANTSIDEKEKLEEIKSKQSQFLADVLEEIERVDDELKGDPSNAEAAARKDILEEVKLSTENEIAETESKLTIVSTEVVEVETINPGDVNPGIKDKMDRIEEDNSLSVIEKQEQLKEQEEDLIASIAKEQAKIDKKLRKDPDNADLKARKDGLTQLKEVTEASIDERDQTLAALNTNTIVTSDAVTEDEIFESIDPEYKDKQKELQKEAKKSKKGVVSLLVLETEMYEELQARKNLLASELESNPDDEAKQTELARVEEMLQNQKNTIDGLHDELVDKIDDAEREELIAEVDATYNSEISNATSQDEVISREVELQMAISEKIDELEKEQKRNFSVSVGLVEKQYKQLLKESQDREAAARNAEPIAETSNKEQFIEDLRSESADAIDKEYSNAADLEIQERSLAAYEDKLTNEIKEIEEEIALTPDKKLEEKKEWLEEELTTVQTKRRKVKIQIGELESNALTSTSEDIESDETLKVLKDEQGVLQDKLAVNDVSSKEKKQIERELEENLLAQTKRENEIVASKIEEEEQVTADLNEELNGLDPTSESGRIAEKTLNSVAQEEAVIAEIEAKADQAKTEEERNYLLKQAETKREKLNDDTQEIVEELKIGELEASENVSLQTEEDLKKKKRSFTIRMGELTNEIIQKEKEIEEAKKKDKPALEQEKESLEEQRELVKNRLANVDEQLTKFEGKEPVVNPMSMKEEITFNEERQLAGTEEYEKYEVLASEALEVENQISNLEEELKLEKKAVALLIADGEGEENEEKIQARIQKIKTIESDIDRLNVDLIQKKWTAEQALPSNDDEAMRMQNLVARGIKPIKTTVVAAALLQLPTSGFALTKDAPSVYTAENPIPVGVESPTGLVYRVQIGAFAKPIPQDLFKEFNPVSGEKINGTNITRYMAGFFNSSEDVVDARGQIRELGYNDAFVVAYCDGKRISFGDARRREAQGTCVPKGTNELMVEVAEKTAEKLGLPLTREVQDVPENSYNKAPGAVEAQPIEEMLGLFFTVQIGVFNRPVGKKYLNNMEELLTIRLPNGQIRYASGRFDSVEEALPRRSLALSNGIKGAFVTAYYKGERIPLSKARGLLAENGASILQSTIEKEAEAKPEIPEVPASPEVIRTDTVTNTNIAPYDENGVNQLRVQVVTKQSFTEYPRDVLNRYNSEGSFYYDEGDGHVKSVIYKNEDYLPRLYNFRDDVDTVYIPVGTMDDELGKVVEVVFTDSIIPGDFMDMLLRFNYRRDMNTIDEGVSVRIYGIQEDKLDFILNELRDFGVEPIVRQESELELELEENE